MAGSEVKEKEVNGFPGWIKKQIGNSRWYIAPSGVQLTAYQFGKLALEYPGGVIPEHVIFQLTSAKKPNGFFSSKSSRLTGQVVDQPFSTKAPSDQNQPGEPGLVDILQMPDPKPHAGRSVGNRASPKELSDGLYISISIATAIVALLLREPTLAASDLEAKNISVPAANLLAKSQLNERFGRLIAESGDWQLLGYAIYLYGSRCIDVVQARRQSVGPKQNAPRTNASSVSGSNGNTGPTGSGAATIFPGTLSNGAKSPPGTPQPLR